MKKICKTVTIIALCLACATMFIATPSTARGESLGELLESGGFGWIIGTWVDKESGGEQLKVSYTWRLKKNAIAVKYSTSDSSGEGMIAFDAQNEKIVHASANDKGGVSVGSWDDDGGKAVLNLRQTSAEGEVTEIRFVHENVNADTMKVSIINAEGEEVGSIELARKKK